jgi:hypothetical protein
LPVQSKRFWRNTWDTLLVLSALVVDKIRSVPPLFQIEKRVTLYKSDAQIMKGNRRTHFLSTAAVVLLTAFNSLGQTTAGSLNDWWIHQPEGAPNGNQQYLDAAAQLKAQAAAAQQQQAAALQQQIADKQAALQAQQTALQQRREQILDTYNAKAQDYQNLGNAVQNGLNQLTDLLQKQQGERDADDAKREYEEQQADLEQQQQASQEQPDQLQQQQQQQAAPNNQYVQRDASALQPAAQASPVPEPAHPLVHLSSFFSDKLNESLTAADENSFGEVQNNPAERSTQATPQPGASMDNGSATDLDQLQSFAKTLSDNSSRPIELGMSEATKAAPDETSEYNVQAASLVGAWMTLNVKTIITRYQNFINTEISNPLAQFFSDSADDLSQ